MFMLSKLHGRQRTKFLGFTDTSDDVRFALLAHHHGDDNIGLSEYCTLLDVVERRTQARPFWNY